jgi:glutamate formiminotransferase/formiminotetrahydrofolate cyclodeaminase
MQAAFNVFELCKAMTEIGNPNSVTDAGVGALCARSAVIGAFYNVKINCGGYKDKTFVDDIVAKGNAIQAKAIEIEQEIMDIVEAKIA